MARHSRSPYARKPDWLPARHSAPLGRREIWATMRAHPKSLWELALYVVLLVAVRVTLDDVLGSSSVFATVAPLGVGFLFLDVYLGRLTSLRRRDIDATKTEQDGL